jgi:hypothetical protein
MKAWSILWKASLDQQDEFVNLAWWAFHGLGDWIWVGQEALSQVTAAIRML